MTAGMVAVALARGALFEDALRLRATAGALNVTCCGLATGQRDAIQQQAGHVVVRLMYDGPR